MAERKSYSSIEEVLASSGKTSAAKSSNAGGQSISKRVGAIKDLIGETKKRKDDDTRKSFSSIQDMIDTVEKERAKNRKIKTFADTFGPKAENSPAKLVAASPTGAHDAALDPFDYAIAAVQEAMRVSSDNRKVARTRAVNLLLANQNIPRAQAFDLIGRAFRYIEK